MLRQEEQALIRNTLDALKTEIPGFREREQQLKMIGAIATAMARCHERDDGERQGRNIAAVDGPPGVGKSVSYLTAALAIASTRGKRVVVSSSTVQLQEQLSLKDAPALQRCMPIDFTFTVAKGRARYACIAKLANLVEDARQNALPLQPDEGDEPHTSEQDLRNTRILQDLADRFESGEWNGDRDELAQPVSNDLWSNLVTDRQGCAGNRCPHFASCPFYAAREKARQATLIIANHDLVLSALATGAATVLPDPADAFWVFDEAHHLSAKVIEHFSAKHTLLGAATWVSDVGDTVRDIVLGLGLSRRYLESALALSDTLQVELEQLHNTIDGTHAFEEKRARRFKNCQLPEWARVAGANILAAAEGLQRTLAGLRQDMLEHAGAEPHLVQRLLAELGFYLGKVEVLIGTWTLMLADDRERDSPTARWIERYESASAPSDYLICASPISAAEPLRNLLWNRASAVALTSATLTSCGNFELFLQQTGLHSFREVTLLRVESTFDYAGRAKLVIPTMRSDPRDVDAHTREVAERLPDLVTTQGTLVLYASRKQMKEVLAQLPEHIRRITLVQGSLPKTELLARHKAAIDRGERSVLFGLASLAEGVDLPGEHLTHVVIAKLPFAVPDSPLEEARRDWIVSQGRSPFAEITLPEAGVRLQQAAGRLLRGEHDYGTVTILDRRLATARWGEKLLRGLPPFGLYIGGRKRHKATERELEAIQSDESIDLHRS